MPHDSALFGKKVFFLNPHSVLGEVLHLLAAAEFEVYTTSDHGKLARYLSKNPESLVFVNVDEGEDEGKWRSWIAAIKEAIPSGGPGFGVLTMQPDDDKRSAYLLTLGVECGFITVKQGAAKTADILLRTLEANEARGRRRFVRAICPADAGDFNYSGISGTVRGSLRDMSVVGMSAFFPEGDAPKTGTRIKDLQLNLKGTRVILNGVVLGGRDDAQSDALRVLMFEPGSLDDDKRGKLRLFIRKVLQSTMEQELALA